MNTAPPQLEHLIKIWLQELGRPVWTVEGLYTPGPICLMYSKPWWAQYYAFIEDSVVLFPVDILLITDSNKGEFKPLFGKPLRSSINHDVEDPKRPDFFNRLLARMIMVEDTVREFYCNDPNDKTKYWNPFHTLGPDRLRTPLHP